MTVFGQNEQIINGVQVNVGGTFAPMQVTKLWRVIAYAENSNTIVLLETGDENAAVKLYNDTKLGTYVYIALQSTFSTWERLTHKEL